MEDKRHHYLKVTAYRRDGTNYTTPLKTTQTNIITKILNKSEVLNVNIEMVRCSKEEFYSLF